MSPLAGVAVLLRVGEVDRGRQFGVVDFDQLCRLVRGRGGLRDDDRDRLTVPVHLVGVQVVDLRARDTGAESP